MNLNAKRFGIRRTVLDMVFKAKTGHIGGDFSVADILSILYFRHLKVSPETISSPDRDRFILSKGHSVESYYAVLAEAGFIEKESLQTFSDFGSNLIGHPHNKINGIEMCSGSLGHGLSVGVGMALAGKMDKRNYKTYVVCGDGELAEGSVWEGIMSAGHFKLDNIILLIDRNRLQISGGTETVMSHENLFNRLNSFNWFVQSCDGNDIPELDNAIINAKAHAGAPSAIICNTTKGYGVSFMENNVSWHHRIPSKYEYDDAMAELIKKEAAAK